MQHPHQQQQSPQMFNVQSSQQQQQQQQPTTNVTTEQIQKYLDENKQLILAIMENQNLGKLNDCAQYQAQLQKNLMYLAAIADAQPSAPTGSSQPQPQPQPHQSAIPQGPSMMQQSQPVITQQQTGLFGARLPFNLQSNDQQQQPHIQLQQSMVGAMGMRAGGNIHPGHGSATHLMMDAHNRQDGSESGYGDGQGKSSGQGWANRES